MKFRITSEGLSLTPLMALVTRPDCGAVASFVGTVRNHHLGRKVTHLEYSAYEAMAIEVLQRIEEEGRDRWPEVSFGCHHRVGLLRVGEIAVVIAVASPHRAEAFAACAWYLDRLKADCPIWKKETGPDGSEWVSPRP